MHKKIALIVLGAVVFCTTPALLVLTLLAPLALGEANSELLREWLPVLAMVCIFAGPAMVAYAVFKMK